VKRNRFWHAAGNRATVTDNGSVSSYASNNLNQYSTVGGDTPTYDSNGNLATQDGWTYTYDAQNRLVSGQSTQSAVSFSYDARNRCVSRTTNGVVTFYYYDEWSLIEEQSASGALIARYVNGPGIDAAVARITPASVRYYHQDAMRSTVALTDANGEPTERYSYDVFGEPAFKDGGGVATAGSASGNRILYTGREYLQQMGLYDYRNRIYKPGYGRFLQPDPVRLRGLDKNLYRYALNNPATLKDPSGLGHCACAESGWTYIMQDQQPNRSDFSDDLAGCFLFVRAQTDFYIERRCNRCDEVGAVIHDQGCVN
jgi:RHS repeat-associated protein